MTTRRGWFTAAAVIVVLFLSPLPASAAKEYRAERFDVRLDIEPGGSLVVTERVRFVFGRDSFTFVYRGLRPRRTDGFSVVAVSMDGRPFTPGDDPGEYEIENGDNGERRVVWHFQATSSRAHDFGLVYRVRGVVRYEPAEDLLEWQALPTSHAYPIDCASVDVHAPASASLLEPAVTDPTADRDPSATSAHFVRCGFARNEAWLVRARFTPRSIVAAPQDWQRRAAQASRFMPLFLGLAGMILLVGAGGFIFFGLTHRIGIHPDRHRQVVRPPDALPVPLGAVLSASGRVTWPVALATLFDLAERGVIAIRQIEGSFLHKQDFELTPGTAPGTRRPSERVLFDLLFTDKSGPRTTVKLSELGKVVATGKGWKAFSQAVEQELTEAGVYDRERGQTRTRVTVTGVFVLVAGFAALIGAVPFIDEYGGAALMIGVATGLAGLTGVIVGQSLTPFTEPAVRRADLWDAYGRHLKALPKSGDIASTAATFAATLPAAVAYGSASAWAKALDKAGVSAGPAWLRALPEQERRMGATVALLTASQSAGAQAGHGAGGVGGGAAGGGTSGAG